MLNSSHVAWRLRAVTLAVEMGKAGQAVLDHDITTSGGLRYQEYSVISATEPQDRQVVFFPHNWHIDCDCPAGKRHTPCSHAGAVLLLHAGLAPARERTSEGLDPNA